MSNSLKKIGPENVPQKYQELVERKILLNSDNKLGKIKYNDKVLHQSKIIKYYIENEEQKKVQKDIDKIFKKISKNRKYFYSAKDVALIDSIKKRWF